MPSTKSAMMSAALACAACVETAEIELPDARGALATIVIILAPEPAPAPVLWAIDHTTSMTVSFPAGATIVALHYDRTLAQLHLGAGTIALEPRRGRPLPAWDRAQQTIAGGSWADLEQNIRRRIDGLRIAGVDPITCASEGGCYDTPAATDCLLPCPMLEPPISPEVPHAPIVEEATCPDGQLGFLLAASGAPFCEPLANEPCPPGDYADDLPPIGVSYVHEGAAAGGTGTEMDPFATITAALEATIGDPERIIAISKGTFVESVVVRSGAKLFGACAAQTRISGGIVVDGAIAAIAGVELAQTSTAGIHAQRGAALDLREVVVTADPAAQALIGVLADSGATLDAERVTIAGMRVIGIQLEDASAEVRQLVIRDGATALPGGRGIFIGSGATATVAGAIIARNWKDGVQVDGARSTATLERIVVRDMSSPPMEDGSAFAATDGGRIVVRGARIERGVGRALLAYHASASIFDAIAVDLEQRYEEIPAGFAVTDGSLVLERARLENPGVRGVHAVRSAVEITDVSVRGSGDHGLRIQHSVLALTRVSVANAGTVCFDVEGEDAHFEAIDVEAATCGDGGFDLDGPQSATLFRARVTDAKHYGVHARGREVGDPPDRYRIDELLVAGTRCERPDCAGLELERGTSITFDRFEVANTNGAGVWVNSTENVELSNGSIHGNDIGLRLTDPPGGSASLYPLMQRVRFEDNVRAIVRDSD